MVTLVIQGAQSPESVGRMTAGAEMVHNLSPDGSDPDPGSSFSGPQFPMCKWGVGSDPPCRDARHINNKAAKHWSSELLTVV